MDDKIKCRARTASECYDGRLIEAVYGRGEEPDSARFNYEADGTYDPSSDSIVCDACFVQGERKRIEESGTPLQRKLSRMFPPEEFSG